MTYATTCNGNRVIEYFPICHSSFTPKKFPDELHFVTGRDKQNVVQLEMAKTVALYLVSTRERINIAEQPELSDEMLVEIIKKAESITVLAEQQPNASKQSQSLSSVVYSIFQTRKKCDKTSNFFLFFYLFEVRDMNNII